MGFTSRWNWNLEMLVFMEGGKPENPEKTLGARTRTNNKLNPHMTPGPGMEPGPHWWKASALTAASNYFFTFLIDYAATVPHSGSHLPFRTRYILVLYSSFHGNSQQPSSLLF